MFLLITLTMYHLYLGLAFVNKRFKSMSEVYLRQRRAHWVFIIMCVSTALAIPVHCIYTEALEMLSVIFGIVFSALVFTAYVIVTYKLWVQIRKLEGMEKEKR